MIHYELQELTFIIYYEMQEFIYILTAYAEKKDFS